MSQQTKHVVWSNDGKVVCLANDQDSYYVQEFANASELNDFIVKLLQIGLDVFGGEAMTERTFLPGRAILGNQEMPCIFYAINGRITNFTTLSFDGLEPGFYSMVKINVLGKTYVARLTTSSKMKSGDIAIVPAGELSVQYD
jgi:hypothetical protein